VATGVTNEEHAAYMRAWRKANPERAKATDKRNYDKNKKGKKRTLEQQTVNRKAVHAYQKRWPDRLRNHDYKRHYGITLDDYNKMFAKQKGKCAICRMPETSMRKGKIINLAVDHNHKTNKIRGLLCMKCNVVLGYFEKHQSDITKVSRYLEKHK
jgi:Recombination endonuclease VII